jgi:hypothetical protein
MVTSLEKEYAYEDGVGIVNCARGGVIDEVALVKAFDEKYCLQDWMFCQRQRNGYFNES